MNPLGNRSDAAPRRRTVLFALLTIVVLTATALVVGTRPWTGHGPVDGETTLTGSGVSTDGRLRLQTTPSVTSVPAGGGPVTYTYAVTNTSATRLFYASASDTKCPSIGHVSGMTQTSSYSYVEPGGTATFTCSTTVSQNTTGTATFAFYEDGGATSTVQASDSVTVTVDPALGTCTGELWAGSMGVNGGNGQISTFVPGGGPVTTRYVFPGTADAGNGTAALAMDPTAPRFVYSISRHNPNAGTDNAAGIWRYDTVTGAMTKVAPFTAQIVVRAAVSPTGVLYFQSTDGTMYRYNLKATGAAVETLGKPTFRDTSGAIYVPNSGDFAFDGLGNLWVQGTRTIGSSTTAFLYTLSAAQLSAGTVTGQSATLVGPLGSGNFNGLGFAADGTLYATVGTTNTVYRIDTADAKATSIGATNSSELGQGMLADIASCNLPVPKVATTKAVSPAGVVQAGDTLTYTVTMSNSGNVPTSGSTFVDVLPAGLTYVPGSTTMNSTALTDRSGQTGNQAFPFAVAREVRGAQSVQAGVIPRQDAATLTFKVKVDSPVEASRTRICNQGTFTYTGAATAPSDDPTQAGATDPTCVAAPAPAIKLLTKASAPVVYSPSAITYTYTLLNDGSEVIANPTVTDDRCSSPTYVSGDTNNDGRLGLTEVWTYTCTTTVSATTTDTARATGTGLVTGRPADPVTAQATVTLAQPGLQVVKLVNGQDTTAAPGVRVESTDTLGFAVRVTNTGTAPLTALAATDPVVGGWSCPAGQVAPGASVLCTASQALPAPAVGAQHTDTVTVTGRAPNNPDGSTPPTLTASDQAWAYTRPRPALQVVKKINGADPTAAPGVDVPRGSTMTIEAVVTNTGNATLTQLNVSDDVVAAGLSCPRAQLAPGESVTCTGSVPAPAVDRQHVDTATAHAVLPAGPAGPQQDVTAGDTAWAHTTGTPGLRVTKLIEGADSTAAPGVEVEPGAPMAVTFQVDNTGDVAMQGIVVTDSVAAQISCPSTTLSAGGTMTCSATIPAPAAGAQHTDTATVVGTPVATPAAPNPAALRATDQAWAYSRVTVDFTVTKLLAGTASSSAPGPELPYGQAVPIRVVVRNTGTIALGALGATDSVVGALTCPSSIPVGGTAECTGVLPAVAPGVQHTDTATVTATPAPWPGSPAPAPIVRTDQAWGHVTARNSIAVVKTIEGQIARSATGVQVDADTMTVRYRVTNTGDARLTGLQVRDVIEGGDDVDVTDGCPATTLDPHAEVECTRTLPAPDRTRQHHDTVTASAQPDATVGDATPPRVQSSDQAYAVRTSTSSMDVVKVIDGAAAPTSPGAAVRAQTMTVGIRITNTGTLTLHDIVVLDDDDADDPATGPRDITSSCITPPPARLAPGVAYLCQRTMPAPAFGAAVHHDVATVTAVPDGSPPAPNPAPLQRSSGAYAFRDPQPALSVIKRINGNPERRQPGTAVDSDTMAVSFEVANTGDAPLTGLALTDTVSTDGTAAAPAPVTDCAVAIPATLAPGAHYICEVTRPAPAVGSRHSDVVTATATGPATPGAPGASFSAQDQSNAYRVIHPGLELVKYVGGAVAGASPGMAVTGLRLPVRFSVHNTGDVPLATPTITDAVDGGDPAAVTDCATPLPAVLAPGSTYDCEVTRDAPAFGAVHHDVARVSALPPATPADPDPAPLTDDAEGYAYRAPQSALRVVKRINGNPVATEPGAAVTGAIMQVVFELTNTGDAPLTDVTVDDHTFSRPVGGAWADTGTAGITCPATTLAAGASMTCSTTLPSPEYGSQHRDEVAASGLPPATPAGASPRVQARDTAYAYRKTAPAIGVAKIINGRRDKVAPGLPVTGDTMTVQFLVTNTGDAPLDELAVHDSTSRTDAAGGQSTAAVDTDLTDRCTDQAAAAGVALPLAPGATFTCTITGYPSPPVGSMHQDTVTVAAVPPATPLDPTPAPVTATDTRHALRSSTPSLAVLKTVNGLDDSAGPVPVTEGQPYTVRIRVTNTGDTALSDFHVSDEIGGVVTDLADVCGAAIPATLAPKAVFRCDVPMPAITGVDTTATDIARVTAQSPPTPDRPNGLAVAGSDQLVVTPGVVPQLAVLKMLDGNAHPSAPGLETESTDPVSVRVRLTNNGNVALRTFRVVDTITDDTGTRVVTYVSGTPGPGEVALNCPALGTGLAPGTSANCELQPATVGPDRRTQRDAVVVTAGYDSEGGQPAGTVSNGEPGAPAVLTFRPHVAGYLAKFVRGVDTSADPMAITDSRDLAITFLVANNGNVPLRDLAVRDDVTGSGLRDVACPATTLAVGASMICSATSPAPTVGTVHHDHAELFGADADDTAATPGYLDFDEGNAYFDSRPALTVVKRVDGEVAGTAPGVEVDGTAPLALTFDLVNEGNVAITDLSVADVVTSPGGAPAPAVDCHGVTTLQPGEHASCDATADAPAVGGKHVDTVTASGHYTRVDPKSGQQVVGDVSGQDTGYAHVDPAPAASVVKTVLGGVHPDAPGVAVTRPDAPLPVTARVTNTGNVPWTDMAVVDHVTVTHADGSVTTTDVTVTCPAPPAPGQNVLCTYQAPALAPGDRHVDRIDVDASSTAVDGSTTHTHAGATGAAYFDSRPALSVFKSINGVDASAAPGVAVAGSDPLALTFTVTNTGNVTVTGLRLDDQQLLPAPASPAVTCAATTLAPGAVTTCTGTAAGLTQGGRHSDRAVAHGSAVDLDATGNPVTATVDSAPAEGYAYFEARPRLRMEKLLNRRLADPPITVDDSEPLGVRVRLYNTGNVDLTSITLHDEQTSPTQRVLDLGTCTPESGPAIGPVNPLRPGASVACIVDPAAGGPTVGVPHVDTVTATGGAVAADGSAVTTQATARAEAMLRPMPELAVVKLIDGQVATDPAGVVVGPGPLNVTVRITNTGNVALSDIAAGNHILSPDGSPDGVVTCPQTTLAVGESMICRVSGVQAPPVGQMHHGQITVSATAPGLLAGTTQQVAPVVADGYAHIASAPALRVVKTINGGDANLVPGRAVPPGEPMDVAVEVVNTGNAALTEVAVEDPTVTDLVCPTDRTLAPGVTWRCTARVPAPQPGEQYTNTATASARGQADPGGTGAVITGSDVAHAWVDAEPALTLSKLVDGRPESATYPGVPWSPGAAMPLRLVVTNTGPVTLHDVRITDPALPEGALNCPADRDVAPGATLDCTATVTGPAAGRIYSNTATATGTSPGAPGEPDRTAGDSATAFAYGSGVPGIAVTKTIAGEHSTSAPGVAVAPGEPLQVVVEVTNTGTLPLSGIVVNDQVVDLGSPRPVGAAPTLRCPAVDVLAPGQTLRCTDTLPGRDPGEQHHDVATATGYGAAVPGQAAQAVTATDEGWAHAEGEPELTIVKRIDGREARTAPGVAVVPGGTMTVDVEVTNTGDVDVLDLAVQDSDPDVQLECDRAGLLRPGWSALCTAVLPAPAAGDTHHDTATATGHAAAVPGQTPRSVRVADEAHAYGGGTGALQVVKKIDGQVATEAPGVVVDPAAAMDVTVEITDTGAVPVTDLRVDDPMLPELDCGGVTRVDPGRTVTCRAVAVAPDAGRPYRNDVTATGRTVTEPGQAPAPVTVTATVHAYGRTPGAIELVKLINGRSVDQAPGLEVEPGSTMEITLEVTNRGLVPVTELEVADSELPGGALTCPAPAPLAPGDMVRCTGRIPAPAAGRLHHDVATASAEAVEVPGRPARLLTVVDEGFAHGRGTGALTVDKRIDGQDAATSPGVAVAADHDMAVTAVVTNGGTAPVTGIAVADSVTGGWGRDLDCPRDELSPGESMECSASLVPPAEGVQEDTVTAHGLAVLTEGEEPVDVVGADRAYAHVEAVVPPVTETSGPSTTPTSAAPTTPTSAADRPGLRLRKSIDGDDSDHAPGVQVTGESMRVGFEITNTGDTPLGELELADPDLPTGSLDGCPALPAVLAPGAGYTCEVTARAPEPGAVHEDVGVVTARVPAADGGQGVLIEARNPAHAYRPAAPPSTVVSTVTITNPTTIVTQVPTTVRTTVPTTVVTPVTQGTTVLTTTIPTVVTQTLVSTVDHTTVVTTPLVTTITSAVDGTTGVAAPVLRVVKKIDDDEAETAPGVPVTGADMKVAVEVTNLGPGRVADLTLTDDTVGTDGGPVVFTCDRRELDAGRSVTCTAVLPAPAAGRYHVDTVDVRARPEAAAGVDEVRGRDVAHAYRPPTSVPTGPSTPGSSPTTSRPTGSGSLGGLALGGGLLCLWLCPGGSGGVPGSAGGIVTSLPGGGPGVGAPTAGVPGAPSTPGAGAGGSPAGGGTSVPAGRAGSPAATGSSGKSRGGPLASTGARVAGIVATTLALLLLGAMLMLVAHLLRRRD